MALITLTQAYHQLRLPMNDNPMVPAAPEYVADVTMKMEQATALVLAHMKIDAAALTELGWTVTGSPATDPEEDATFAIVQAAILEVLTNLWADRGDREKPSDGPISARVKNMLSMHRDPTIA